MKKIIEDALNSTELTDRINDAASLKIKLSKDLKADMKEVMGTYVQTMIDLNPAIKKIQEKSKKARTEEDWVKLTEFVKKEKKNFQSIKKAICPVEKADGTKELPLKKMVSKLAEICRYVSYLGRTDILDMFKEQGIEISFKPLEEDRPELKEDKTKEEIKYIFQSAEEIEGQIQSAKAEIKKNYLELDPAIRYSKEDPKNLEGLKPAQFEKLAKQRAVALTKSPEDYTSFKEKNLQTSEADIISMQLTFEKMQEM
jgi:hypothetical protein